LPDAKADETWAKEFLDEAFRKNPGLQALKAGVEEADASLSLARKANIPDFAAGVEMDVRSAPVLVRPSGSMTLPVWRDKISAMIASAEAKRKSAGARLSAAQISLAVDFAEKSYMTREASRNIILFDEKLIPKSRLFVSIATTSYANGAIDFNTLLDAERMLLALEIGKIGAVLQNNVSTADMILLVIGRMPPSTLADEVGQTDQNNLTGGEK
jgi:outer membrane protein TolC